MSVAGLLRGGCGEFLENGSALFRASRARKWRTGALMNCPSSSVYDWWNHEGELACEVYASKAIRLLGLWTLHDLNLQNHSRILKA